MTLELALLEMLAVVFEEVLDFRDEVVLAVAFTVAFTVALALALTLALTLARTD